MTDVGPNVMNHTFVLITCVHAATQTVRSSLALVLHIASA